MPRPLKGPRLYLRECRKDAKTGKILPAVYFIRDGAREISTRCGPGEIGDAERQLAAYITAKHAQTSVEPNLNSHGQCDPSQVTVAEVLDYYLAHKVPKLAVPTDTGHRVRVLLDWWGDLVLTDVRRSNCQKYVEYRMSQPVRTFKDPKGATTRKVGVASARRELEDLSAAIGFYDGEYPLMRKPTVWFPEKPVSNRDALTRSDAAALLWAAMGHRKMPDGTWKALDRSTRSNRKHLCRFILIGLYTGTRSGVLPKLLWKESAKQAWVDLEHGMIYRRGKQERDHKNKRRPVVKLPRRLLAHMRRWKAMDDKMIAAARARGDELTLTTVLHHGGAPLSTRVRKSFSSCVADAGLNPKITPHWLRHTAATWLMERGANIWEAAGYTLTRSPWR